MSRAARKAMIARDHPDLSLDRQCQPVDMMDKVDALPTSPQAPQHQQIMIDRIRAA